MAGWTDWLKKGLIGGAAGALAPLTGGGSLAWGLPLLTSAAVGAGTGIASGVGGRAGTGIDSGVGGRIGRAAANIGTSVLNKLKGISPEALAVGGLGAAGGFLSGRKGARQQTAIEPPEFMPLRDQLISKALERLRGQSTLPGGYLAEGVQNINRNAALAQQALENRMGGAGLLGSGIHGAGISDLGSRRFGDINQLENIAIPRMERDFANQDIGLASGIFGQRVPGTQLPGSALGEGLGSGAELLAYMYGQGNLQQGGRGAGGQVPQQMPPIFD
jgi:hypothetical protein